MNGDLETLALTYGSAAKILFLTLCHRIGCVFGKECQGTEL